MAHILFISHSNGFHGAERVMQHQIQAQIDCGNRVSVLIPSRTVEHDLEHHLPCDQLTILHYPYKSSGKGLLRTVFVRLYNLPSVLRLMHWCKQQHVDTLYSNTSVTILGAQMASLMHIKHIWHFHEPVDSLYGWHSSMRRMYRKWIEQPYTITYFISQKQRMEWEKELGISVQSEIHYNPVFPIKRVATTPHTNIRIGYLGSLEKRKNIPFLIRVFERIHAMYPNTELWICGARDTQEIELLIESCHVVNPCITITKATNDVAAFYSNMDIFALPSLKETMPLVSLEAMGCGVCTIQTTASGLEELVTNEEDCLFVSPTDEDAWVKAISQCMNETYRSRLAQNGLNKWKQLCE